MTDHGRCSFCGAPAIGSDRVGSMRMRWCDDVDCQCSADGYLAEAEREQDDYAREMAERDNYDRYR